MTTVAQKASDFLNDLRFDHMVGLRLELYQAIEQVRVETRHENDVVRVHLQNEIKRIGSALEECRAKGIGPGDVIYDELVRQIRAVNFARAHNRARVNRLAEDQAIQKAALAELNREISYWEADDEYEAAMDEITLH